MSIKRTFKYLLGDVLNPFIALILSKFAFEMRYFRLWEKHGFHVTPNHFYYPIPDTRFLGDTLWERKSQLVGIEMNVEKQIQLLGSVFPSFENEYDFPMFPTKRSEGEFYLKNGSFESVDAEVLHCMIRHFRPNRIIEIGMGNSTLISARASLLNRDKEGIQTELTSIEPHPNRFFQLHLPGLSKTIQSRVERVESDIFLSLKENDILFIDSSHVVRIGGDVNYLLLEVLPRLKRGVVVHLHDIYLPAEYDKTEVLGNGFFFTEQYILQAFLAFNPEFEIIWASSYMHLNYPNQLKACFRSYRDAEWWPTSLWIRRKRPGDNNSAGTECLRYR